MSFTRSLVLFGIGACVPSAIDDDPKGGAAVTLVPSTETQGAPFTTPDGWTITIEKFAVRAAATEASTVPGPGGVSQQGGSAGPFRILVPGPGCGLRVSGVVQGAKDAVSVLVGGSFDGDTEAALPPCGVDDPTLARFNAFSEDNQIGDAVGANIKPGIVLVAQATKGDRHIKLDIAVNDRGFSVSDPQTAPVVTIKANVGQPVSFPIQAEAFFIPQDVTGVTFDQMVATDVDGDGVITGRELALAPTVCEPVTSDAGDPSGDGDGQSSSGDDDDSSGFALSCPSVLDAISENNLNGLFGKGTSP